MNIVPLGLVVGRGQQHACAFGDNADTVSKNRFCPSPGLERGRFYWKSEHGREHERRHPRGARGPFC